MLPLFREYQVDHHRFREHHTIAVVMSLLAPVCAFLFFREISWWNPWLWGCCGAGLSLALCLHSVVLMLRKPEQLSAFSRSLARKSKEWFPYFFITIQSAIAALIVMFVWFSVTTLTFDFPIYVHIVLVLLALLIPARRLIAGKMTVHPPPAFERTHELIRAAWHILASIFLAQCIIALVGPGDRDSSGIYVQIAVWVPAVIYILYTFITTLYHLANLKPVKKAPARAREEKAEEPVDRF